MFKKKPNVKPLAPIRSSDRRKTADQIIAEYGLERPARADTSVEDKAAATAERANLRNSLLPDNVQSARFTTTHGPDLRQVSGTVYVGKHPGEEERVLWFKIEDKMYPTVYTLWRHPGILPLLLTPDFVVQKLQGGADLMTPGLQNGPPFPAGAKKGAVVAIASLEKPSVPVAVGTCLIDVSALQEVQGARGHAVQTMHWAGDEVWSYSISGKPGQNPPEELEGWMDDRDEDLGAQAAELTIDDEEDEGGVTLANGNETIPLSKEVTSSPDEEQGTEDQQEEKEEEKQLTTKEIDAAFRNAFLYGIRHYMDTNKSERNHGLVFPLTQSFIMSNLVQPFLPAYTPSEASSLQIKKTSWKNIKKFIKALDKAKIVKSKERDGHETTIIDIDFADKEIQDFKPYRLPKKETQAGTSLGRGEKATTQIDTTSDPSVGQKLQKLEYYKPSARLLPLFTSPNTTPSPSSPKDHFYLASEIRPLINHYIERESLLSPTNKRLVTLNPTLANAVFDGTARLDTEVLAKGTVPRDALADRIVAACAPYHAIVRIGNNIAAQDAQAGVKPKAGPAPKVRITLETRSGNKTVTKVSGLEGYMIGPTALAEELRKVCAGSAGVEQLQGSSPRNPVMEVMVQGPQREAVMKALERRGVRGQWVEVVDKTKGKKR